MAALMSVVAVLLSAPTTALAHCDTMEGPVVTTAKVALEKGDVTPVLKWVRKEDEAQIKALFAKTLVVRGKGAEAKDLADMYFLETLVRLHRAGEGVAYTGLKSAPVEPIIAMADKALETGSADEMIKRVSAHVAEGIRERFARALEAKKHADESVAAGREYVEDYVQYTHCVEGIHAAMMSEGHHHQEGSGKAQGHEDKD